MEISSKIALFGPKMSQKGPRAPLGPPRMTKIVFSSCQDMETLCQEKEFLSYLPQEKSWYGRTMATAAMLDFRALGRRWPSGISGNVKKFKGDNVLDHLKSKNGCSGGGAPRVFLAPALPSKKTKPNLYLSLQTRKN